ncbi:MAG: MFS transporter [Planctomycetaceae bacterium]|nr:MFS transporter [Planctomycetaceae bacterium]
MTANQSKKEMVSLSDRTKSLSRSVVFNQTLFTAGYSLTSGGFLVFFAADLGASTKAITWILTLPELVGMLAVLTPCILCWVKNKKQLFLGCSVLSRIASLLIPLAVLLPGSQTQFHLLVSAIVLTGILQAIGYTAYLSWLTDLAPEKSWGRFFARRNMAKVAVLVLVPFGGALLRDWFKNDIHLEQWRLFGYVIVFGVGNLLQLTSLIPLLKWPAIPNWKTAAISDNQLDANPVVASEDKPHQGSLRSLIFVLLFSWWLAFFQGLTQTAFFLHSYRTLHVSMTTYYLLVGSMYLLQLLLSWWAGTNADRKGYRNMLFTSTLIVSLSMICWAATINGNWLWLWGAYLLWGGFGVVNLSLQNLLFTVATKGKNTLAIALSRNGAGLIAGLTGLAGGYWLEQMLSNNEFVRLPWGEMNPFLFLFLLSFAGRFLAPVWLLGIKENQTPQTGDQQD